MELEKSQLMLLIGFVGFIFYLIQNYAWPKAGQHKDSHAFLYSHQLDVWTEDIYAKFDALKRSKVANTLVLKEKDLKVNERFFQDLESYHLQIERLLMTLRYLGQTGSHMVTETAEMIKNNLGKCSKTNQIVADLTSYMELLDKHTQKQHKVSTYLVELKSVFNDAHLYQDKVDLTVKQTKLLAELYQSEDLFLKHNTDPFMFVRDFGVASNLVLKRYEEALEIYNKKVNQQLSMKKTLLLALTVISVFLSFKLAVLN